MLERSKVLNDVRSLDQDARGGAAQGRHPLWRLPSLSSRFAEARAAHSRGPALGACRMAGWTRRASTRSPIWLSPAGRRFRSTPRSSAGLYRAAGFRVCGGRAVRVDILERLADLIRPAISYRPGIDPRRTACRHGGWRRLCCHRRHDVAGRLRGRRFRHDPEIARLFGRSVAPGPPSPCRWSLRPREVEQPAAKAEGEPRRIADEPASSEAQPDETAPKVAASR